MCFESCIEVQCGLEVNIVFLCLLHHDYDSCHIVQGHVHHLLILALVKESTVLVYYELVMRI